MTNPFTQRLEQQAQKQAQQRQTEENFYGQSAAAAFGNPHLDAQRDYQHSQQLQRQLQQTLGGSLVDANNPRFDQLRTDTLEAQNRSDLGRARTMYGDNPGGFVQQRMDALAMNPQDFRAQNMNGYLGRQYMQDQLALDLPYRQALASTLRSEQDLLNGGGITITPTPAGGNGTPTFSSNPFT